MSRWRSGACSVLGGWMLLFPSQGEGATPAPAMPGVNVPAVKINTAGYPPSWAKIAVFQVPPHGAFVEDIKSGEEVFWFTEGTFVSLGKDAASGDPVWQADFSDLTRPGIYRIRAGRASSDPFPIREDAYAMVLPAALKMLYLQRCRTVLEAPFAEWEGDRYERAAACHFHDGVAWDLADFPERKRRWRPEAGWHDAGNYEMYVPSTAPTALALLYAYKRFPRLFPDGAGGIPESGNDVPDVLDEAAWGIRWVLSLQEKGGGVRNREAVEKWTPEVSPDRDESVRWISGVGTASTGKACALFALAARVYREFDPGLSERCQKAAWAAWRFLQRHPERIPVDGKGSPQPLWDDDPKQLKETGARFLAAVEVWKAFRSKEALEEIRRLLEDPDTRPEAFVSGAWVNLSRWGLYELVLDGKTSEEIRTEAAKRVRAAAESLREQVHRDGYRCATRPSDYYWGHNSNLLEKAELLAFAGRVLPDAAWALEAARDQWHWILGRNPNGFSMVTRVGKGPTALYHMEWGSKPRPPPGYVVGGPNHHDMTFLAPEAPAKALLWDNPGPLRSGLPAGTLWHWKQSDLWDGGFLPEGSWDKGWWAVTEPDIYYNANLILVAGFLLGDAGFEM